MFVPQPNPELETRFDDEQHASDVAAVLKAFSVQKAIFVGWSYGALIPTDYMTVHGCEGVRGMVIASGLTGHMQVEFRTWHQLSADISSSGPKLRNSLLVGHTRA